MTLTSSLLAAVPGLRHAFFTREGGVSGGIYSALNGGLGSSDDQTLVAENRRRMAEHVGVAADRFLSLHQIHSPDVLVAETPPPNGPRPKGDALVTNKPGIALGVSTADCGPVLFVDPNARVIGGAHAGWKGALTGVLESTISAMEKLGATRSGIIAAIGPLIRQTATRWATSSSRASSRPMPTTQSSSSRRCARATQCSTSPASFATGSRPPAF